MSRQQVCAATVHSAFDGHINPVQDFIDVVKIPYGSATLRPTGKLRGGEQTLSISLDLPGGHKYSLMFEGTRS